VNLFLETGTFMMYHDNDGVGEDDVDKYYGWSVRCVKTD